MYFLLLEVYNSQEIRKYVNLISPFLLGIFCMYIACSYRKQLWMNLHSLNCEKMDTRQHKMQISWENTFYCKNNIKYRSHFGIKCKNNLGMRVNSGCCHNFNKIVNYLIFKQIQKKMIHLTQNYSTLYPKNCHQALKNMGWGSVIRKTYPGSRGQKSTGSRIHNIDTSNIFSLCLQYFTGFHNKFLNADGGLGYYKGAACKASCHFFGTT